jgi:3-hydroxyisobutyrate dehydrogenase-like beta-hydroxyacid dehydrogenase
LAILKVGFIGIGNMGMPMAKSLVKNGLPVTVFDLNGEALAEIKAWGASAAESPVEVALKSDSIITMVKDESQTDQITWGSQGLWEGLKEGSTLILSSTLSPGYCRNIHEKAKTRNVSVIDAPVTDPSGPRHVLGGLTIMIGGDREAIDRNQPIFLAMGKNIFHLGKIGNGQICKLVNQINAFNIGVVTRESLNMGVKAGVDLKTMVEALSLGLGSTRGLQNMAETLKAYKPSPVPKSPGSRPTAGGMGLRDRVLALELAKEIGVEMPIADCISQLNAESLYEAYAAAMREYTT